MTPTDETIGSKKTRHRRHSCTFAIHGFNRIRSLRLRSNRIRLDLRGTDRTNSKRCRCCTLCKNRPRPLESRERFERDPWSGNDRTHYRFHSCNCVTGHAAKGQSRCIDGSLCVFSTNVPVYSLLVDRLTQSGLSRKCKITIHCSQVADRPS